MNYKEEVKQLTTKELYDEIISHSIGDSWDGVRTKKCERELKILEKQFKQKMIDLGVIWE